jgi:hypothetical protein
MPQNINSRKRTSAVIRKMMRISQGNNMGRTNRSITRIKEALEARPRTHPNPQEKESRNPSIK